jgi:hypothetical protein
VKILTGNTHTKIRITEGKFNKRMIYKNEGRE